MQGKSSFAFQTKNWGTRLTVVALKATLRIRVSMIPSRAPPARQRCMEAPSRCCGCTTQPVPKLFPALRTTAPPRRSFCQDTACDTDAPRPRLCSYNNLLPRSTIEILHGFNNELACLWRFFSLIRLTTSIRHTVLLSLSRQYASIRHDHSPMDWKKITLLFHISFL